MTTPVVNSVGIFTVLTPFSLDADTNYTCTAVRNFDSLKATSVDVFSRYYQPNGLDDSVYLTDLDNNVSIVTLVDSSGTEYFIPTSYILGVPAKIIVPYSHLYVTFDLKALPDALDITSTLEEAELLFSSNLGITATAKMMTLPITEAVTFTEHTDLETARNANINLQVSTRKALEKALLDNADLQERISSYETIFSNLNT